MPDAGACSNSSPKRAGAGHLRQAGGPSPPAFLVDRDKQPIAAVDFAQAVRQPAQLFGVLAVPLEKNVARRVGLAEKCAFVGGQFEAGTAEDCWRHDDWKVAGKLTRGKHLAIRDGGKPGVHAPARLSLTA